ncbi:polyprenol phosphomannose-dependent alpha 1,6 mannosyltransferase MptB [Hoyosella subflava]|uniref:Putative membrane protein n=1 Tax=Hoyosella subflava (strain DSM 45089 / JCM 17490 / NBRC 109087 / DQS3-9A1) TaxID=443218 RepID=F6EMJ0_HOYSD|nr:polyprenol phosphomannose-dependent alpha 1,6 mannosyltransferase MptB [Hoyosella subflava]AEF40350.1 Putative membrane protein [Hoyosella subflava DQS3-9A1]
MPETDHADSQGESARKQWSAPARRTRFRELDEKVAHLHGQEFGKPGLNPVETAQLKGVRRFGAAGAILMAFAALGAGAQPVLQNPVTGMRIFGLPARMTTVSLTLGITGTVMVTLAWLMVGRFVVGGFVTQSAPRRMTRGQLDYTLLLWITPLLVAPPMFSRDVYSYLAQSEIGARGLDPYALGPAQALGVDHVLTRTVPNIWRETPAPYGPLFLWMGEGIASLTGYNIVPGILLHRGLAVVGVLMIIWALPRLARRCGVDPVIALWLGAANPLVIFHLVAGIHNEALMIGMMVVGAELALRAIESSKPLTRLNLALLLIGVFVIVLSATIKIPSLLALGFVGMALARRWGRGLISMVAAAALLGIVAIVGIASMSLISGLGFGWVNTLGTANAVRSWMSIPTLLGLATGQAGVFLGLGDHTTAILNVTRPIAAAIAAMIITRMLFATHSGRLHAIGALGVSMAALVFLFPVVQPWYLLWALIPLAAWATRPVFRIPAIGVSAVISVILMPNGAEYPAWTIFQAVIATIATFAVLFAVLYTRPLWRSFLDGVFRRSAPSA